MKLKSTLYAFSIFAMQSLQAQYITQYFDGEDTIPEYSIVVVLDTAASNIWQIGEPEKIIFDTASTLPNVLITDLNEPYPDSITSAFTIKIPVWDIWGVIALTWSQKLDFENGRDGGYVEFYNETDNQWENAFESEYTYNFYGYDPENTDTLPNGAIAFTGTDTTWRDLWLCLDESYFWYATYDSIEFRFTFMSDSNSTSQEGWMIDNFTSFFTYYHTIKNDVEGEYIVAYPNLTSGEVTIEAQKVMGLHYIETIEVFNVDGRIIKQYGACPTKFRIDLGDLPNGMYFIKVTTNVSDQTIPVVVSKI